MRQIKKQRNSTIELLRILCILMVIAGHYYAHGIAYAMAPFTPENYTLKILAMQLISFGADIANDFFVIITGYYMIHASINRKRIFNLFAEMIFYAWAIVLLFHLTGLKLLSGEALKKALLPFWSGENWFVTCYLLLCLIIPFLNPFLKSLEQKQFAKFLAILFFIRFVTPLLDVKTFWSTNHGFEQFIFLYFIGAYINLHGLQTKILCKKWCCRVILIALIALWLVICAGSGIKGLTYQNAEMISKVTEYFPIFSVLISSFLLVVALGIKPFYCNFINLISGSVLAVYLIHDNPLVREYLWWTVSPNINQIKSNHVFIHMAQKTLVVFAACILIDLCRIWLIERPLKAVIKIFKK